MRKRKHDEGKGYIYIEIDGQHRDIDILGVEKYQIRKKVPIPGENRILYETVTEIYC